MPDPPDAPLSSLEPALQSRGEDHPGSASGPQVAADVGRSALSMTETIFSTTDSSAARQNQPQLDEGTTLTIGSEEFIIGKKLGAGVCGVVYEARLKETQEVMVVKLAKVEQDGVLSTRMKSIAAEACALAE
eukprot:623546-Amphidinium_carterae.1